VRLQPAPSQYNLTDQNLVRETINREDDRNLKSGVDIIFPIGVRLVLTSPNGTKYALSASNVGVLTLVAYP